MDIERWADRIYTESDFGRSVATSAAGVIGLGLYLYLNDWVIAAFSAVIAFPICRIVAGDWHSNYVSRKAARGELDQARKIFERVSAEEREVLMAFVRIGGCVMSWSYANSIDLPEPAVSSLMQRGVLYPTTTADGVSEAFAITVEIFDVAKENYVESDAF